MSDQARTIYLVGPITGIADHNAPTFDAAEEQLCAAGYRVVNPLDLHGARQMLGNDTKAVYMRRDILTMLRCCQGVALLERRLPGRTCAKAFRRSSACSTNFHVRRKRGNAVSRTKAIGRRRHAVPDG